MVGCCCGCCGRCHFDRPTLGLYRGAASSACQLWFFPEPERCSQSFVIEGGAGAVAAVVVD